MHYDIDHIDVSESGKVITFYFKDGTSKYVDQPYEVGGTNCVTHPMMALACALLDLSERYYRLELRLSRLEVSSE